VIRFFFRRDHVVIYLALRVKTGSSLPNFADKSPELTFLPVPISLSDKMFGSAETPEALRHKKSEVSHKIRLM
jgi:hypothetical protein